VVTVNADLIAPTIVSAIGDTNMNVVTVTLNDNFGINQTQAGTAGNYDIHLTAGGGNLTVSSAVPAIVGTNTVVTLTTATPRLPDQNYTLVVNNVRDVSAAQNLVSPNSRAIVATVIIFSFGQNWRTIDSLTTTTGAEVAVSASVNSRPRMSGIPIAFMNCGDSKRTDTSG